MKGGEEAMGRGTILWPEHPSPELLGSCQRPHLPGFRASIMEEVGGGTEITTAAPHGMVHEQTAGDKMQ